MTYVLLAAAVLACTIAGLLLGQWGAVKMGYKTTMRPERRTVVFAFWCVGIAAATIALVELAK
jgi:hypothetical protein